MTSRLSGSAIQKVVHVAASSRTGSREGSAGVAEVERSVDIGSTSIDKEGSLHPLNGAGAPDVVVVRGDTIIVEHLEIKDDELARFVAERNEDARPALAQQAFRVGLIALRNAGVTLNVDYVEKEFERLLRRTADTHEKAALALDASLRQTFADGEGRLPRTLERFLGDKGTLRKFVDDLFDAERRDSAIGRMRTLLAGYFDGDGAIVARMLDPRRDDSPLHGFRTEVQEALNEVHEGLLRIEGAREARAAERAKGTAKGADFEDIVEARLGEIARGCGDVAERTGTQVGNSVRGRSGDFVLTLNPTWTHGQSVRVALEAKSGPMGLTAIIRELEAARRNRGASVAVAVFAHGCAPNGCAPLTLHGEHVLCEIDPDDLADNALEAAVRLARALAVVQSRDRAGEVDLISITRQLEGARNHLKSVTGMKSKLTSVANVTREMAADLDTLRQGVLDCIVGIEEEVARPDYCAVEDPGIPGALKSNRVQVGAGRGTS